MGPEFFFISWVSEFWIYPTYLSVWIRIHKGPDYGSNLDPDPQHCLLPTVAWCVQCTGCESLSFQRLGQARPHENGKNIKYSLVTGPPVGPHCQHCANRKVANKQQQHTGTKLSVKQGCRSRPFFTFPGSGSDSYSYSGSGSGSGSGSDSDSDSDSTPTPTPTFTHTPTPTPWVLKNQNTIKVKIT